MISPRLTFQDLLDQSNELYETTIFRPTIQAPLTLIKTVSPTINDFSIVSPLSTKINLSATVLDEFGGAFPSVNISVNGIGVTQTDSAGFFTLYNVVKTDTIKITHVGYRDLVYSAGSLPGKVQMQETAIQLQSVIIPKKPTPIAEKPIVPKPTNWLLWGSLGMAGILLYKKYSSKQVVKAKI